MNRLILLILISCYSHLCVAECSSLSKDFDEYENFNSKLFWYLKSKDPTGVADILCDKKNNPSLEGIHKAKEKFEAIKRDAIHDDRVKKYGPFSDTEGSLLLAENICLSKIRILEVDEESKLSKRAACDMAAKKVVHEKLYTKERLEGLSSSFRKVQKSMVDFLQERIAFDKKNKRKYREMIKVLNEAKLVIPDESMTLDYNAFAETKKLGSHKEPKVIVHGLITLVETAPETLDQVLAHELGHLLGTTTGFQSDSNYTKHPFKSILNCLKTEDSIGAKLMDKKCIQEKWGKKFSKIFTKIPEIGLPPLLWGSCQGGQLEEAWADWIAFETTLKMMENSQVNQQEYLLKSMAWMCDEYDTQRKMQIESDRDYAKMLLDHHPLAAARIGRIFAAHPRVKEIIFKNKDLGKGHMSEEDAIYCK